MAKLYILYNPIAGNGQGEAQAHDLGAKYPEAEVEYVNIVTISDYVGFLNGLDGEDTCILCGGDGTVTRFAREVYNKPLNKDVYYYAAGSGNDFWTDLGRKKGDDPVVINEYLKALPVVTVNGVEYPVLNGVGFGIDGYCCEEGDKQREKSDKPVNYTGIAIKGLLFHYKPTNATVTVDGVKSEYKKVWIAPTMHGRFYGGGMMPTPSQKRNNAEGTVSLCMFHGSGKLKTLMIFPSLFKGEHIKHTKFVTVISGKEIEVKFDRPAPLQIDGETIVGVTEYKVRGASL
ncbi:MAG: diacylglycerol kinase family protein [Clostridia bacterium]|nr:diacylglycerol kinase family protein [Clostridia bacterium]